MEMKAYLWKLGLFSSNVLGSPANPLLQADVTSAADFTKESGPKTNLVHRKQNIHLLSSLSCTFRDRMFFQEITTLWLRIKLLFF